MPIIGFLFALTLSVSADTNSGAMTLDDFFLKAVDRSYALVNQGEVIKQAEENYNQAWQNFTPVLSASAYDNYGGYFSPSSGQTNTGNWKLALNQPLFHGFRNIAILEQSKYLIDAQKEAKDWAYSQLYLDTAQAFFSLLSVSKQLEHLSNQVKLYDDRTREIASWVSIGRSRSSDLSSIKAARTLVYSQMVQARGLLSNNLELFRFMTGLENFIINDKGNEIPGTVSSLDSFIASSAERPDLKAAKAQNFSVKKALDIARSDRLPWADLSLSANDPQFWNVNTPVSWNIQLTLTYSLFADSFVQSKIRQAESLGVQSDSAYQFLSDSIQRDIRISYAALLSDLDQVKAYIEAVGYLKDNYHQMERDYRLGVVKLTDVLTAVSSYEDAVRVLDSLIYTARMEKIRLLVYSGQFRLPPEVKK